MVLESLDTCIVHIKEHINTLSDAFKADNGAWRLPGTLTAAYSLVYTL